MSQRLPAVHFRGMLPALCLLACASAAAAQPADLVVVPPPKAYVEFCFREVAECPRSITEPVPAAAPANRANAKYWTLVFEAATPPDAVSDRATIPAVSQGAAPEPRSARIKVLDEVNASVNRAVVESADAVTYQQRDYWALPLSDQGPRRGDCEDFVLEKRRALRLLGVAPEEASIALVKTPWGQNHAVLLVSTDAGKMVLDNLSPRVELWSKSSYTLIVRQDFGHPDVWLGNASGAHTVR